MQVLVPTREGAARSTPRCIQAQASRALSEPLKESGASRIGFMEEQKQKGGALTSASGAGKRQRPPLSRRALAIPAGSWKKGGLQLR